MCPTATGRKNIEALPEGNLDAQEKQETGRRCSSLRPVFFWSARFFPRPKTHLLPLFSPLSKHYANPYAYRGFPYLQSGFPQLFFLMLVW